jgi:hypothetical protein
VWLSWRSHARPGQRRRFGLWPEIGAIHGLVQKSVIWRTISFAMAVCWRRSSAVQKPRTAFAQLLAALNHRLSQGLGMSGFLDPVHEGQQAMWDFVPAPLARRQEEIAGKEVSDLHLLERRRVHISVAVMMDDAADG